MDDVTAAAGAQLPATFSTTAGFFGKVVSNGDFVSRRLPPALVGLWDAWLQAGLQASREQLGTRWLDVYLTSPVWRFALAPGACDDHAWAGVLMPSVDRVGRHFPLTIAAGAPGGAALLDWLTTGQDWYAQAEALALSTLQEGFVFERFDNAVQALAPLPDAPLAGQLAGAQGSAAWRLDVASFDALAALAPQIAAAALRGHSLWWTEGSAEVAPSLLMCRGLPSPEQFGGMLAGIWPDPVSPCT
ncbi:type VI secretion system-associated protein TagF [Duganella sp. LX20W]|uniref:Type VI secretion system-associated protein TagF n=1 Tax=Rugamonas brunnea TaxID=2758569 RepID=A0A7W2ICP4_9BURK|nr:type VI secretion system-associated protein TagF [Rugamonas brunnea]MBA5638458.1 type VI secretion system-associated protein TagF [Rugamonas brunnea]